MNNKKISKIIKEHIQFMKDDNFKYQDISSAPSWLTEMRQQAKAIPKRKKLQIPRWGAAVAGALAMFIFMLSPVGHAVSEFLYNIDIQWNEESSSLEIQYKANVEQDPIVKQPKENLETTQTFSSLQEAKEAFPDLRFVSNNTAKLQEIIITGLGTSIQITSDYSVNNSIITVSQTIFYTDTGANYFTELTDNAVPIETSFCNNTIRVNGGYEDGYGNATALQNNCEYNFLCTDLPMNDFVAFIENCYIE